VQLELLQIDVCPLCDLRLEGAQEEAQAAERPGSGGWRSGRGRNASSAASPRGFGSSPSQVIHGWDHAVFDHGVMAKVHDNSITLSVLQMPSHVQCGCPAGASRQAVSAQSTHRLAGQRRPRLSGCVGRLRLTGRRLGPGRVGPACLPQRWRGLHADGGAAAGTAPARAQTSACEVRVTSPVTIVDDGCVCACPCACGLQHDYLLHARRPQRRAKRLFDAVPEETETPDDEDEDAAAAAAEDDDDLFVDLDLKAPAEEGAPAWAAIVEHCCSTAGMPS